MNESEDESGMFTVTPIYPKKKSDEEILKELERRLNAKQERKAMIIDQDQRSIEECEKLATEMRDLISQINLIRTKLGEQPIDHTKIFEAGC